ncbi:hypothetical protein LJB90_00895 [Eubacteriales bacterium OttesenSCG-928-G02]|nr:hypothetical protein [Eubacteriales bacterium OttesenSCG-928-G02]
MGSKTEKFKATAKTYYRRILGLLVLVLVIAVVITACGNLLDEIYGSKYNMQSYEVVDFNKHKSHFNLIANSLYEYFIVEYKNDNDLKFISVDILGHEWIISCHYYNESKNYKKNITQTKEEINSFDYIDKSFSGTYYKGYRFITVFLNRVCFRHDIYGLVYSLDRNEPKIMHPNSSEKDKIYVQRLTPNWYQCIYKNQ